MSDITDLVERLISKTIQIDISLVHDVFSDLNECTSAPCQNGAACVDLINKYVCNCPFGFSGINCETGKRVSLFTMKISIQDAQPHII